LDEIGSVLARFAEHAITPMHSILSFFRRAGAVRIDVVDVLLASVRRRRSALRMQPMIGFPSGLERVRWKASHHLAAARDHAQDFCAARRADSRLLQHQRTGTFRHDEAIAVFGKTA